MFYIIFVKKYYMTSNQIITKYKNFKFYKPNLLPKDNVMAKLDSGTDDDRRRFILETEIVNNFHMCFHYYNAPDTYDILKNPKQTITRQEIEAIITSKATEEKEVVHAANLALIYISKKEFQEYKKAYTILNGQG